MYVKILVYVVMKYCAFQGNILANAKLRIESIYSEQFASGPVCVYLCVCLWVWVFVCVSIIVPKSISSIPSTVFVIHSNKKRNFSDYEIHTRPQPHLTDTTHVWIICIREIYTATIKHQQTSQDMGVMTEFRNRTRFHVD